MKMDSPVQFEDDFEEYHARATSGGSLYGLLRRQAFIQSGNKRSPEHRRIVRQRSKSLIPKSVALPEERGILKLLCEYTETSRKQTDLEQRRHSTACLVDARDASHIHPLSPICSVQRKLHTHAIVHRPTTPTPECIEEKQEEEDKEDSEGQEYSNTEDNKQSGAHATKLGQSLRQPEVVGSVPVSTPSMFRRRSFSVTPKGVVNEGDDIVTLQQQQQQHGQPSVYFGSTGSDLQLLSKNSRSESFNSLGSAYSGASSETQLYRVLMLGGPGVGKSALTQQFLTSEYMAAQNTSFDDCMECTVPVLLDGEESIMEIIDLPYTGDPRMWKEYDVDCYVVVYSIIDRRSFRKAMDLLTDIRREERSSAAMLILVANKTDLVRSRLVGDQEAKAAAQTYDCKYIEVSAILNHHVDELLVGALKQLRYKPEREKKRKRKVTPRRMDSGEAGCLSQCHQSALTAFFGSPLKFISKSCENLLSL